MVVASIAFVGCVGALAGGTFGGGAPQYWGAIDVAVVTADGAPRAGVSVQATIGVAESGAVRDTIAGVTDLTGHARLELDWVAKHSARDSVGDYVRASVSFAGQPSTAVEVIVRPAVVSSMTLISKAQETNR